MRDASLLASLRGAEGLDSGDDSSAGRCCLQAPLELVLLLPFPRDDDLSREELLPDASSSSPLRALPLERDPPLLWVRRRMIMRAVGAERAADMATSTAGAVALRCDSCSRSRWHYSSSSRATMALASRPRRTRWQPDRRWRRGRPGTSAERENREARKTARLRTAARGGFREGCDAGVGRSH